MGNREPDSRANVCQCGFRSPTAAPNRQVGVFFSKIVASAGIFVGKGPTNRVRRKKFCHFDCSVASLLGPNGGGLLRMGVTGRSTGGSVGTTRHGTS